jgi:hypothetical protein
MGSALRRPRVLWLLLAALAVLIVAVVLVLRARDGDDHGSKLALYGFHAREAREKQKGESEGGSRHGPEEREAGESAEEKEREGESGEDADKGEDADRDVKESAAVIKGHDGGEGDRHGARTPWGEQVGNRAYPRGYVDDERVRTERRAFRNTPGSAPRSSFRSKSAYQDAIAAAPGKWTSFGPETPNVAGEASQFLDPVTQQGPPTQESGRVTALAADPNCEEGDCKLWVAAAGGGIWHTDDALALHPQWKAPPDDLPTDAFGSLYYDAAHQTLYAGSGEPNGSGDSEAGLGLFKSTDFGDSWTLVPGSAAVATNRSIGAIATDPRNPNVIYIGTALARHGSSSVNGGRRTPPDAPALGVYKSTDGGQTFTHEDDLTAKTPPNPTDPGEGTGSDWFQGGINKLELDPNNPDALYAGVLGYGVWRSGNGGTTWTQVFHTMNQNDFDNANDPGDTIGDRTEFDLVDLGSTTRAFLGDASDDWGADGDDSTPAPRVFRSNDVSGITGSPEGDFDNTGWTELTSDTNGDPGFGAYGWCQNGQCGYDSYVASPPGHPNQVWLLGSMNYDELPAYAGAPPRSNGRAVIRSTNANGTAATTTWHDMTAVLNSDDAWDVQSGLHPDEHAVAFSADGNVAFVGSDGGVARVDVSDPVDASGSCDNRRYVYDGATGPEPLNADDLADCHRLLNGIPDDITPINDGLDDLQFQSLSVNPKDPEHSLLGGTQDNGTWSFGGNPAWYESVGGDGGQSGFDAENPDIRYHNYYDATPEVNFHGDDPTTWLAIYDTLQSVDEARSFYTPFIADPVNGGRAYTGLQHVWRTDDHGGRESDLAKQCNSLHLDPGRKRCGDWAPLGPDLTADSFGDREGQYVAVTKRATGDDGTLWAATRTGRVFISKNADGPAGAVEFTRLDDAGTPGRFVSGIAIDPFDPDHAFVSYSGYGAYTPQTQGHVFDVTFDPTTKTATWKDLTTNLGDQPVTDVALNGDNGDLYASTDFGVLRLPKGSSTWEQAAPGLPQVAVYGLTMSDNGHVLYAATHGRGAYAISLPAQGGGTPTPTPTATATATATATSTATATATATVTATPTTTPTPGGDTKKPSVSVSHIKTVRRPARTTIKGLASDASGLRTVTVRFGDGKRKTRVKLTGSGRFTVRHRYAKPAKYEVTVTVTDKAGNTRTVHRIARVRPRKKR